MSTILDIITDKIQGNRKSHTTINDNMVPFGLAVMKKEGEPYVEYHHYAICGNGADPSEAVENFWLDYESKGPYGEGDLFWRRKPELVKDRFDSETLVTHPFSVRCRFSICANIPTCSQPKPSKDSPRLS